MKRVINLILGIVGGFLGAFLYSGYTNKDINYLDQKNPEPLSIKLSSSAIDSPPIGQQIKPKHLFNTNDGMPSFIAASKNSTQSVVFIQTTNEVEYHNGSWMNWFFEPRTSQQVSSGSGVIYSSDGYIITNNHVIDNADKIKVVFEKKTLDAVLIGADPSTDLAIIKVDSDALPAIKLGNSDELAVGEWVLAVGNPFNLASTVTAGIVSAKGRNINILKDRFPIESFIQTDAAINPGNSGGALVNSSGDLVGINTAILSKTGSYSGYGFAVPVNIVKKVAKDIIEYGEVQKVFFGATFETVTDDIAERLDFNSLDGVIITQVQKEWPADKAGLHPGDVIIAVNGSVINNKSGLEEMLAYLYPGDKLSISFRRDNKTKKTELTLTNKEGTTKIIKRTLYTASNLGAIFESIPKVEKDLMGIKTGIRVVKVNEGFFRRLEIPEDFIITDINRIPIDSPEELADILEKIRGKVIIYGIDKRGKKMYYPYIF